MGLGFAPGVRAERVRHGSEIVIASHPSVTEVLDQSEIDALLAEAGGLAEGASDIASTSPMAAGTVAATTPQPIEDVTLSAEAERELQRILALDVPVIVRLASRTMCLSEVLRLTTGAILEFDKSSDADLELLVSRQLIGGGQAVKIGENFGLRISAIVPMRQKIEALTR